MDVTLDLPVRPLREILAVIRTQTGVEVEAPRIGTVPILLKVTRVGLPEVLAKIAEVTGSSLVKEGNGFRLVRTDAQAADERRKEVAETALELGPAWDKFRTELTKKHTWDDEANRARREALANTILKSWSFPTTETEPFVVAVSDGNVATPATRLLAEALTQFPAERLAWIESGQTAGFASQPRKLQAPLTLPVGAVPRYVTAHNSMVQGSLPGIPAHVSVDPGYTWRSLRPADVNRVSMRVHREGRSFTFQLLVTGPAGELLGLAGANFRYDRSERPPLFKGADIAPISARAYRIAGLVESSRNLSGANSQTSFSGFGREVHLTDQRLPANPTAIELSLLASPDKTDPLELLVAPVYRWLGGHRHVIVRFHDGDLSTWAYALKGPSMTLDELGERVRHTRLVSQMDEHWLSVRPKFIASAERADIQRGDWGDLAREIRSGCVSWETGVRYVGRSSFSEFVSNWLKVINFFPASEFADGVPAYRVDAILTPRQRNEARIPIGAAPAAFEEMLRTSRVFVMGEGSISLSRREVSEVPVAGLYDPIEAVEPLFISRNVGRPQLAVFGEWKDIQHGRWEPPYALGVFKRLRRQGQHGQYEATLRPFDRYRPGSLQSVDFNLVGAEPRMGVQPFQRGYRVRTWSGEWTTLEGLGPAYREEIAAGEKADFSVR